MMEREFDLGGSLIPSPWCNHSEDKLAVDNQEGEIATNPRLMTSSRRWQSMKPLENYK
jgi:hypothetical protein